MGFFLLGSYIIVPCSFFLIGISLTLSTTGSCKDFLDDLKNVLHDAMTHVMIIYRLFIIFLLKRKWLLKGFMKKKIWRPAEGLLSWSSIELTFLSFWTIIIMGSGQFFVIFASVFGCVCTYVILSDANRHIFFGFMKVTDLWHCAKLTFQFNAHGVLKISTNPPSSESLTFWWLCQDNYMKWCHLHLALFKTSFHKRNQTLLYERSII